ncbi:MAG: POTRA domain-containing protein [Planctomycetota bacterium]|nr:POTRA domain-containing protein [Planctomycetota bacterium]
MAVIRDFLYGLRYACVVAAAVAALVMLGPVAVQAQYSREKPYSDETLGNANALANKAMESVSLDFGQRQPSVTPHAGPNLINAGSGEQVIEIRIVGNKVTKKEKILPHIRTRAGREFIQEQVERDVRRLNSTRMFVDIRVSYQHLPNGRVVIFEVVERPTIEYVKYIGNRKIKRKLLAKETNLKVGDSLDPYMAEDARRSLELFYHDHGFGVARVTVVKGSKTGDRGVAFLINEGPKQRILKTDFIGNTVVSAARLRTQVKAKHGFMWVFGGEYDRKLVAEDRNRLTNYYHGLGYFQAKIGTPEITYSESREWISITYVINEGQRYTIRSVSVVGNKNISGDKLLADLKLGEGDFFSLAKKNRDAASIEEEYGSVGYIFAKIRGELRFDDEPGQLDIVYDITEGEQYRVGRILPQISGENPHTQISTMLNRISLQPGDIVDIREIRDSKRRLKACGLFEVSPQTGVVPDIVISDPSEAEYPMDSNPQQIARPNTPAPPKDNGFRGQSPDDDRSGQAGTRSGSSGGVRWIDLNVIGRWADKNDGGGR